MTRSQMRLRSSRPPLMRARTTKPGKIAKLAKTTKTTNTTKAARATKAAKAAKAKLAHGRSKRRPSTRFMMIAGGAACCAAAIGVAALPVTRRAVRRMTATAAAKRQQRTITPAGLDELTGLPNRTEAEQILGAALSRGKARGRRVALLYLDLDDFKLCNDTYGTEAGDHVLQVTAARMQAQLRSGDTVCRIGDDDFVVIMESAGPDHTVTRVGERITEAVAQPITYEGESMLIGASLGVAIAVNGEGTVDELIAHAGAAVDRARAAGRQVVTY